MRRHLLVALVVSTVTVPCDSEPERITVRLEEGTNMALALGPDARSLVIDLQGRLWALPLEGGSARALTDALGDARQPSFAPGGRRVVFQSYRDGNWHLWSVGVDGKGLRRLTHGPFDDREPVWSHDGSRIAFSSDRGGSYDLWSLDLFSGSLTRLTEDSGNEFQPAWSPDDGSLVFVSEQASGVTLRTLAGGAERILAEIEGDAAAPSFGPDGSRVAFVVVDGLESRLDVLDVASGAVRSVSRDGEDVFPFRAAWLSRDELVYTADGRIRRRTLSGDVSDVPFSATVELERPGYRRRERSFDGENAEPVRGIIGPAISPEGDRVAFVALGDLWLLPLGGAPERLTNDPYVELYPAWSPDGTQLVYACDREGSMDLWIRELASGNERRLTESPDAETLPVWSPDGSQVGFLEGRGSLKRVDVRSGEVHPLHDELFGPSRLSWSPDGSVIAVSVLERYSTRFREGRNVVLLFSDVGTPEKRVTPVPHRSAGARGTDGPVWSPDGQKMAFSSDGALFIVPVSRDGEPVGPPRRMVDTLAESLSWTRDSRTLVYLEPRGLRRLDLESGAVESIPLELSWPRKLPEETFVVHAGRLFDGRRAALAENVDVVVTGHRIREIVPHAELHHAGRVIDASRRTVMPGLIEMHSHQVASNGEALGRLWLAYGITSVREPASNPYESRERLESIESGRRPGPREFFTGWTFDGSRTYYPGALAMDGGAQVEAELDRAAVLGYDFIKTYVRLSDPVQKRIVARAHEMGIPVTSHELYPAVAYGADGTEHYSGTSRRGYSPKISRTLRSYQDIITLLSHSGMTMTPTIGIFDFATAAIQEPSFLGDERIGRLLPEPLVARLRDDVEKTRERLAEREERLRRLGKVVKDIRDAGGRLIAGTDSPILPYAVSLHAELHHFVRAGLTPFEALQTATLHAAEALGAGEDLGTLEAGKLADLVIVEGNPLEDIHAAMAVRTVIANGRVYTLEDLLRRP